MTFIVGSYTSSLTPAGGVAAPIGKTKEGFKITETPMVEWITTDESGDVKVDGVLRGQECRVTLDYAEYDSILPALYMAEAQGHAYDNVGKLVSTVAAQLVLTPAAGTTAKTLDGTKVYTFFKCFLESDIETLLKNGHRTGPVTFYCLPDPANGNKAYTHA
jgi:hypothetical protein